jgi:hypothetical protein
MGRLRGLWRPDPVVGRPVRPGGGLTGGSPAEQFFQDLNRLAGGYVS